MKRHNRSVHVNERDDLRTGADVLGCTVMLQSPLFDLALRFWIVLHIKKDIPVNTSAFESENRVLTVNDCYVYAPMKVQYIRLTKRCQHRAFAIRSFRSAVVGR